MEMVFCFLLILVIGRCKYCWCVYGRDIFVGILRHVVQQVVFMVLALTLTVNILEKNPLRCLCKKNFFINDKLTVFEILSSQYRIQSNSNAQLSLENCQLFKKIARQKMFPFVLANHRIFLKTVS